MSGPFVWIFRVFIATAACGFVASGAQPAFASEQNKKKPAKKAKKKPAAKKKKATSKEDKEFEARFAALKKQQENGPIKIAMAPTDDPNDIPQEIRDGIVLVANKRKGIYTPPLLSPDDILGVINEEMATIRRCYKAQLEADPEWSDDLIMDISVKKTGRVNEISLSPGRVQRAEIGKCLLAEVPKWKFPQFTGELDDGVTQEVVNASFPFSFSYK